MTTQTYQPASQRFLAQAKAELPPATCNKPPRKAGERPPSCCRPSQNSAGWDHERHLSRVASRLRAETRDRDVYRWHQVTEALDTPFTNDVRCSGLGPCERRSRPHTRHDIARLSRKVTRSMTIRAITTATNTQMATAM